MRRSQAGGFTFWYSIMLYSASLILVGVSYKMMLTVYFEEKEEEEGETGHRMLHLPLPFEEYKEVISKIYGYALAASLFFLDMMLFSHRGFADTFSRFYHRSGRPNVKAFVLGTVSVGSMILTCFCGRLFGSNLTGTSLFGLFIVVYQILARTQGMKIFWFSEGEEDNRPWPNVTEAQSVPASKA